MTNVGVRFPDSPKKIFKILEDEREREEKKTTMRMRLGILFHDFYREREREKRE